MNAAQIGMRCGDKKADTPRCSYGRRSKSGAIQVVEFGHTLRDTDMLDPKPTGDEVVIAVKSAGVCHSDLHIWEGDFDLGGGRKLTLKTAASSCR